MKKFLLFFLMTISLQQGMATTYYSVADGDWTANIWSSSCSTCAGGALPALVNGDILIIDNKVTIASGPITTAASVTLYIRSDNSPNTSTTTAKLIFTTGGKLELGSGSSVTLQNFTGNSANNPGIDGTGAGGSNLISIGGTNYWQASNGDVSGTGSLQPGGTLPIKLSFFKANTTEENVVLSWATSLEENFDEFIVERSADGKDFISLGAVKGEGRNLNDIQTEYVFEDAFPLIGNNYYRLTAVDLDGTVETFKAVMVKLEGENTVSVFPNPVTENKIEFKTNFKTESSDRVYITNQLGLVISSLTPNSGFNQIALTNQLSSGIYFLIYKSAGYRHVSKIVIE
jgi:hypothetical protein